MNIDLPETHFHLNHLPPLYQKYIDNGLNAIYQWPQKDYISNEPVITDSRIAGKKLYRGIAIESDGCTQHGNKVEGIRHNSISKTIYKQTDFQKTPFGQDLQKGLGEIGSRFLYNPPMSLYDWHQDLGGHECAINYLLNESDGAITLHRFPTDCKLNYKVVEMKYKLHCPVLMKSTVDHCIINLTNKPRYIMTIVLLETTYEEAKKWLLNYEA
jgi:hypothetical protein